MLSANMKNSTLWTLLDCVGTNKAPAQPGGGADKGSMTSTQEWQRSFFPSPHFLFDWIVAQYGSQGTASSHQPACKSQVS